MDKTDRALRKQEKKAKLRAEVAAAWQNDEEHEECMQGLFSEPEDFYKPPAVPTQRTYTRPSDPSHPVVIHLLGSHPLWGHMLWNASIALADYMDSPDFSFQDKTVLELGAGGALPSLIALKKGAKRVIITDYPDKDLIDNIQRNVDANTTPEQRAKSHVMGHLWGSAPGPVLDALRAGDGVAPDARFDIVIMADVIFNHPRHHELMRSAQSTISVTDPGASVFVSFTHHRPHLSDKDLAFFALAESAEFGYTTAHVLSRYMGPMFERDFGPEEVRSTVHLHIMHPPSTSTATTTATTATTATH
eukprot:TRINITY_DN2204_c0_g1_i1.p1 TRINITY_DN2204_c0_g1~~TRINITY_DN2204_c0_g1_i1.p1  ORF type:complete len:304 (+),score=49.18 TRINITY_DN2204_c0_g1_i1:184-1095(+)